jgi:hypothetical protein
VSDQGAPPDPPEDPASGPDASPLERTLDFFVYAPLGVAVTVIEDLPGLADRGRQEISNARIVGKFVLERGQREITERLTSLFTRGSRADTDIDTDTDAATHEEPDAPLAAHPEFTNGSSARTAAAAPAPAFTNAPRPAPDPADAAMVEAALADYDTLSASQVVRRLESLGPDQLRAVHRHEASHRNRRTILNRTSQLLGDGSGPGAAPAAGVAE